MYLYMYNVMYLNLSVNTELFLKMAGRLVLSPSERLLVCGVGGRAEVTCTTTEHVLRWQITVLGGNGIYFL